MAGKPLISVVIPAYNAGRTLRSSVESALAQTVEELEVIIVDDGSSDDTVGVAKGIEDARVRVLTQPNRGAAAARNTGIDTARGEWVAFLDADDIWLAHKLERQLDAMAVAGGDAAQSGATFVDDDLRPARVCRCTPSDNPLMDFLRFRNMPAALTTLIVRRSKFAEMGPFATELVILEEWDMMIKAARFCGIVSVAEPLALYRVHPGNRSRDLSIHIEPGFIVLDRLFADPELPAHIRQHKREIYGRFYTMLAGGAYKIRDWRELVHWGGKALRTDPRMVGYMAQLPVRRIQRSRSRRRANAVAESA